MVTSAVAQVIFGVPITGLGFSLVSGVGTNTYVYNQTVEGWHTFTTAANLATAINTYSTDVNAANVSGTITVTAITPGTSGNLFYLIRGAAADTLKLSNVSQGATGAAGGTRYFEGGTDYVNTLLSAQRPVGIKTVYIKTASELWQNLGGIRNGVLKITPETSNNTVQNNLAVGSYLVEAKFELLQTSVAELEKVDSIIDGTNSFLFRLTDAATIPVSSTATEGWVVVSNSQIGVKARYVTDGDPSVGQFVELSIQGSILSVEMDSVVKAVIDDADFHLSSTASESFSNNNSIAGGTLFGYYPSTTPGSSIGVLGNNKASGFASVELKASSESTYLPLSRIENSKLTFDWIAQEDSCRRWIVISIDVNIEYEVLATDADTLQTLESINETETDMRITLFDGKVFTFESKLGIETHFDNSGDFNKFRKLPFKHKGNILTTAFDAIIS